MRRGVTASARHSPADADTASDAPRRGAGRPTLAVAAQIADRVLDAALQAFSTRGVEATSMDAIAAAARASKRTIYARFGSKEALLAAALEHAVVKQMIQIAHKARAGDPRDALVGLLADMLAVSVRPDSIALERLVLWAHKQGPQLNREMFERTISTQIRFLADFLEAEFGLAPPDPARAATILFEAAVVGPRRRMLLGIDIEDTAESRQEHIAAIVSLFIDGLSGWAGRRDAAAAVKAGSAPTREVSAT